MHIGIRSVLFFAGIAVALVQTAAVPALAQTQPLILRTIHFNPKFDTSDPNWARDRAGGRTWLANRPPPMFEWTQILDPASEYDTSLVGVSGILVQPPGLAGRGERGGISDKDVPFTHPFGFDWVGFIVPDLPSVPGVPDPPYTSLLAPSNAGNPALYPKVDPEYAEANSVAAELGLPAPNGVLGVEFDQDFIPPNYRPQTGDRVAVFGRWIVDSGHEDFHTEIHPPLLIAQARGSTDREWTFSTVISRPYLVGQKFPSGSLREHLEKEVAKVCFLTSSRVEAHPNILEKPFLGKHTLIYNVRPGAPRKSSDDQVIVHCHFTVRPGIKILLQRALGNDEVVIIVEMDSDLYTQPPLPKKREWNITPDDLQKLHPDAATAYRAITAVCGIGNPIAAAFLDRGILTDRYEPPVAASERDSEVQSFELRRLPRPPISGVPGLPDIPGQSPLLVSSEDDRQPFPVYGWLNIGWERH